MTNIKIQCPSCGHASPTEVKPLQYRCTHCDTLYWNVPPASVQRVVSSLTAQGSCRVCGLADDLRVCFFCGQPACGKHAKLDEEFEFHQCRPCQRDGAGQRFLELRRTESRSRETTRTLSEQQARLSQRCDEEGAGDVVLEKERLMRLGGICGGIVGGIQLIPMFSVGGGAIPLGVGVMVALVVGGVLGGVVRFNATAESREAALREACAQRYNPAIREVAEALAAEKRRTAQASAAVHEILAPLVADRNH